MKAAHLHKILLLSLGCIAAQPLWARSAADAETYLSLSLDELLNIRLTSSTLYDESIRSVPSSMTVYTHEQIRDLGLGTLAELMDFVPGYQTARTEDTGFTRTYSNRGRRLGTGGREVLMLLDGKRLNSDFNGGAAIINALIPLDNVERVEFIRGPGSAIYGSNAVTGVVNVITRGAREINAEIGNTWRSGSVQTQFGDHQRALNVFYKQGSDRGQSLAICDAYRPACDRLAPVKTLTDTRDPYRQKELYLRGQWGEFSSAVRWAQRSSSQFYVTNYVNNASNDFDVMAAFAQLVWDHPVSETLSWHAELSRNRTTFTSVLDLPLLPTLVTSDAGLREQETGAKLIVQGHAERRRWLIGMEYRRPEVTQGMISPRHPAIPPFQGLTDSKRTIVGYFGQYQTHLSEATDLILGLRLDDYSDVGHHLSKRLGLIHQVGEHDTLKYLYSTSFRAPSVIETHSGAGYSLGAQLQPEVATNHEAIWLHTLDNGLLSASLYTIDVKNAIYETSSSNFLSTWGNGHERTSGLELEWQQPLSQNWSARLALTRMFERANPYSSEAPNLFSGSLVYKSGPWTGSLRLNYQGRRIDKTEVDGDTINTIESSPIGGHTLAGAHLSYKLNPACEVYGQVSNLFDKRYYAAAQVFTIVTGIPERGRAASIGVRWAY